MHARRSRVLALPLLSVTLLARAAWGQAIAGTAGDANLAVVFPSPVTGLPAPQQITVTGIPSGAQPHGVSPFGTDRAVISDFGNSRLFVVQISTAKLVSTIATDPYFNGTGTIALNPAQDTLFCSGAVGSGSTYSTSAALVRNPKTNPTVEALRLPGATRSYQTEGIVFDASGRAFVSHTAGITVFDPPYSKESFTIPVTNPNPDNPVSGALAISPDGKTLLATDFFDSNGTATAGGDGRVRIYTAPFSAASTPAVLTVPNGAGLDGITVTPDGSKALVVGAYAPHLYVVAAPFTASSAVEEIQLPTDFNAQQPGFEDVTISSDGQIALVTGNSIRNPTTGACDTTGCLPALFVKAPFTRAGATAYAVTVTGPGRGAGAIRYVACEAPAAPVSLAVRPNGNPTGPVTATDFLDLSWQASTAGTPPSRYEWRINGDAYQATTATSVAKVAPRAKTDLVNLFVRGYACSPEKGPGTEAKSADYSMAPPKASFTPSKTTAKIGETVTFTDTSSPQATSWVWLFGNAGVSTSQNPGFAFTQAGTYGVVLVATNGSGTNATSPTFITVTASSPPPPLAARALSAPADEAGSVRERAFEGVRFTGGAARFLEVTSEEDAVVWLQIRNRRGELLAERRLLVAAGERPRVDLAAYLPEGARGRLDVRVVADRPVSTHFMEEQP